VASQSDYLRELLTLDEDFEVDWADSVIRLALQGRIEVGERDGVLVLRMPRQTVS
jgi:Arc/MetJ-type ribon-helix-helix transcriptional regulator